MLLTYLCLSGFGFMHATYWVWLLGGSFQKSTVPPPARGTREVNSSWQSEQQTPLATDADHQPQSPLFIPNFHWLLPLSTHPCCHPSIQKLKTSLSSCFLLLFAHSRCLMEALKIEVNSFLSLPKVLSWHLLNLR